MKKKKWIETIIEIVGDVPVPVFADQVSVTSRTVYNWLNGQKPPLRSLPKLAKVATREQMERLLVSLEILSDDEWRTELGVGSAEEGGS